MQNFSRLIRDLIMLRTERILHNVKARGSYVLCEGEREQNCR